MNFAGNQKVVLAALIVVFMVMTSTAWAGDLEVAQKDKAFVVNGGKITTLKVKVGDVVAFKNLDPYFHNIFSLSDTKLFDLGSFPQGQSRTVTFNKAGKVEVECAIHPQMKLTVEVK